MKVEPDYIVSTGTFPAAGGDVQAAEAAASTEGYPFGVYRIEATQSKAMNTGAGVVVAIVDTGIDLTHPDLAANIIDSTNIINSRKTANDDNGHGSHCAGIVAAAHNGAGIIGVAPDAKLLAVKVLNSQGSGYSSDVADGIIWAADHGAQVISMSLGSSSSSSLIQDAVEYAASLDIVIVCATGNSGNAAPGSSNVNYPAKYPECIAISAWTDLDGTPAVNGETSPYGDPDESLASFSCTGSEVEFTAPGVNIYSCYKGGIYATMSGTSMATPHAAAVAALNIKAGQTDIRAALAARCEQVDALPEEVGAGLVRASAPTAPTVTIVSPSEGATVYNNVALALTATATDAQDGDLSAAIDWSSDLDGDLGTGAAIIVPLSLGTHTITASVTNSNSLTTVATLHLTVEVPPPTPAAIQAINLALVGANQDLQVQIHVQDDDSAPLAGLAVIYNVYQNGVYWRSRSGTTDASGNFTFVEIGPGAGILSARVIALSGANVIWNGASPVATITKAASTTAQVQAVNLQLVNANRDLQVAVHVQDSSTAPLAGVALIYNVYQNGVYWRSRSGTTDASGNFIFVETSPAAGVLTAKVVSISGPGMAWNGVSPLATITKIQATVQAINLALVGAAQDLQVQVQLQDSLGAPLPGAAVTYNLFQNGVYWRSRSGTTNASGGFTFTEIGSGAGTLTARVVLLSGVNVAWNGSSPVATITKTAAITAVVQGINLQLVGANQDLQVQVRLVDGSAQPLPGATVTYNVFQNGVYWRSRTGTTDANGWFTFTEIGPAPGTLGARVIAVSGPNMAWNGATPLATITK